MSNSNSSVLISRHRQRTHALCDALLSMSRELGPEAKFPTIAQLASQLGASSATISDALGELEQRKIVQRVRGVGVFVAPARQTRVALVCNSHFLLGTEHSPFYDLLIKSASQRAHAQNEEFSYHLTLPAAADDKALPDDFKESVRQGEVQGTIGVGINRESRAWLQENEVPTVTYASGGEIGVTINHEAVARLAVHHLASQGCRDIAYWAHQPYQLAVTPAMQRFMGRSLQAYRDALGEVGLSYRHELVHDPTAIAPIGSTSEITLQKQGYDVATRVFGASKARPDGVVIINDVLAAGALAALRRFKVAPGEDVQIASHSNAGSPTLLGYEDEIARLEIDPQQVIESLFGLLDSAMAGQTPDPSIIRIEPQLRASS